MPARGIPGGRLNSWGVHVLRGAPPTMGAAWRRDDFQTAAQSSPTAVPTAACSTGPIAGYPPRDRANLCLVRGGRLARDVLYGDGLGVLRDRRRIFPAARDLAGVMLPFVTAADYARDRNSVTSRFEPGSQPRRESAEPHPVGFGRRLHAPQHGGVRVQEVGSVVQGFGNVG